MVHTPERRRKHYVPEPRKFVALNDTALFILERVYRRRFLTTTHILMLIEAIGGSLQQTRWLLRDLTDAQYLMRIRHPIKRVPNTGSRPLIYGITNVGADTLAAAGRVPRDHINWTRRNAEVNDPSSGKGIKVVPHTLLVSDIMIELEACAIRSHGAVCLIETQELIETVLPEKTRETRYPFSWRVMVPYPRRPYPTDDGEAMATIDHRPVSVAPDCVFALTFAHAPDKMFVYFLEADRSIPHVRHTLDGSATFRKLLAYAGSWSQNLHQTRFNFPSFQVLTVTTGSKERVTNMVNTFKLLDTQVMRVWDKRCPHRVFLFADRASVDPSRLLGYAWVNGNGVPRSFDVPSVSP